MGAAAWEETAVGRTGPGFFRKGNSAMQVTLVMFKADGGRKDLAITKKTTIFGRNSECDYQIPLAEISRRHCQITLKNDKLTVRDLGSSNGTYVNNKRVQEEELHPTDTLTLGPVVFTVVIDGVPKEVTPVKTHLGEKKKAAAPEPKPQPHELALDTIDIAEEEQGSGELNLEESEEGSGDDPLAALEEMTKKKS